MRMTQEALERGRRRRRWTTWFRGPRLVGVLAVASLAAAGALFATLQRLDPAYATQAIEQKVVRLEDGSRVHLNVDSRVKVAFRDGERRVSLTRGEAFFEVAHDASRPFVVEADGARIRALGTKFDVRRENGAVNVTLLQGAVRVSPASGAQPVVLAPNQQAVVQRSGPIRTAAADAARTTSWTTGRLMFRQTPLASAIAEVNRYSDREVVLSDPALGARTVSGFFDVGDAESFAKGVAGLFDLSVTDEPGGRLLLSPPAAKAAPGA
ncbi:FecR family protein [Phenylobacterium sp. J367]|uniref:FecR family protein n=1 Tax=Phenylobacterium sp. J367 TaxID=2898435 RepID=UPI002150937D|nr:FecR domain-containing protein [Phenylobacterium sp. J367]MCR5879461.1 FecR domain-containing protein [Phenylobacterium sp. J367]